MPTAFEALQPRLRRLDALRQALHHLEWDQHTYMPPGGVTARSAQVSHLSSIAHEILTAPETGRLLAEAEKQESDAAHLAALRELRWDYSRATLVPQRLVEETARETSEAFPKWVEARKTNDYAKFRPSLERLVELRREYAAHVDKDLPAYEVLFNDYEPWITMRDARRVLSQLREGLRPLVQTATEHAGRAPDTFSADWPADRQMALARRVVAMLGYDFEHGRLDVSPHPFSSGNPYDSRITTRFESSTPIPGLLAAIHEAGHAIYVQGLPKHLFGLPVGDARDLVVHESQSRLWENHVGRSLPFWERALPILREEFPGALPGASAEDAWRAVNHAEPTHVRVYADELTYHMHIALRFEIEEGLVSGSLPVRDVPQAWNDLSEKYLGIRPPTDALGCLQDMHWSTANFGYFPTYSLGSMLSAQLYSTYERQTRADPTDYARLKSWLVENVHQHGKLLKTMDLIQRATGTTLSHEPFLAYAKAKYAKLWAS